MQFLIRNLCRVAGIAKKLGGSVLSAWRYVAFRISSAKAWLANIFTVVLRRLRKIYKDSFTLSMLNKYIEVIAQYCSIGSILLIVGRFYFGFQDPWIAVAVVAFGTSIFFITRWYDKPDPVELAQMENAKRKVIEALKARAPDN